MGDSRRVQALDGVRGLAILMVLLYHFHGAFYGPHIFYRVGWTRWDSLAAAPIRAGWAGVDLFFALSGCLITRVLLDARGTPCAARRFYVRRAFRIVPLYYAILVAAFFVAPAVAPGMAARDPAFFRRWPWAFGFASNVADALAGRSVLETPGLTLAHAWSLAVEEQFYQAWPALILLASRRAAVATCLALVAAAPALRVALVLSGHPAIACCMLAPCRADALAAGALVELMARGPGGAAALARPARRVAMVSAAAIVVVRRGGFSAFDPLVATAGYSATAALSGSVVALVIAAPGSAMGRAFASRPLRALGDHCYGLYLIHPLLYPVFHRIAAATPLRGPVSGRLAGLVTCFAAPLAISLAAAWLSMRLVERPFLRIKDRMDGPGAAGFRGDKTGTK